MSTLNQHEQMLETKILTAPKEELTLMLYDGALKFSNQAVISLESGSFEEIENSNLLIGKVQKIIKELQLTLNREYPISTDFARMYEYLQYRLIESNLNKDAKAMKEVRDFLRRFRDLWKEAMLLAKTEKK